MLVNPRSASSSTAWPAPRRRRPLDPAAEPPAQGCCYLSSPIGLGHARRDLAIAEELRRLRPGRAGRLARPAPGHRACSPRAASACTRPRRYLANESAHVEREAGEHDLHAFQAIRRMDEILVANFMVFDELVEREHYDPWVGDEAWDLDYFLHENPELKTAPYAWLTDFVGWLPMPDGGEPEAALTADYNAEMVEQIARFPRLRDRSRVRRRPRGLRARRARGRAADDPRLDRAALRLRRLRHRLRAADRRRAAGGAGRRSAGRRTRRSCVVAVGGTAVGAAAAAPCGRGVPGRGRRGARDCGWSSSPARASTRRRCARRPAWRCTATSPTSTGCSPRATSASSRAG